MEEASRDAAASRVVVVVITGVPGQAELEVSRSCIKEVFSLSLYRWHVNMGFLSRKGFGTGKDMV